MQKGLREYLGVHEDVSIYLDNGSFAFWKRGTEPPVQEYIEFVRQAKPDWYPVPADYIPHPKLSVDEQKALFEKTMHMNSSYSKDGYVPVLHAGDWLLDYVEAFATQNVDMSKGIALGALVPRLLTMKGASSRRVVINTIKRVRELYEKVPLHIFGIGGTTTLHLAAVLKVQSVDSSGWRNRAARGLILIPGKGERSIVKLGSWRGVEVSEDDIQFLSHCQCPACRNFGIEGLRDSNPRNGGNRRGFGSKGFANRATHNLWILLQEAKEIEQQMEDDTYKQWYGEHVASLIFRDLITYALNHNGYLSQ
jgi:hypothetical protein